MAEGCESVLGRNSVHPLNERSLVTDGEFLQNVFVTFRAGIFQIRQKPASLGDHDEQSSARGVVLFVRLEVIRELENTTAQESNLYFRGTRIGFMSLILNKNLPLCVCRQCHSRACCSLSSLISF
jgi:hypothetical protein